LCIASASLMTKLLCGMTRRQADAVCAAFRHLNGGAVADEGLGKLALFATVRGHPSRIPCVTLAWTVCQIALTPGEAENPDTTERMLRHIIV
jgi:NifU-like protein involved in Fe-S cluster formation